MNKEIEIYVEHDSNEDNLLFKQKGYRSDVYVKTKNKFFKMEVFKHNVFFDILKEQYDKLGFFISIPSFLIVKKVTKEDIIHTALKNAELNYFDKIKECEVIGDEIMYPLDEETVKKNKESNLHISVKINKLIEIYSYKNETK